jgi:hypothetical protein
MKKLLATALILITAQAANALDLADLERAAIANALNLDACQIKEREEIEKRRYLNLDLNLNQLSQEQYALNTMRNGGVSRRCLSKQKKLVKKLDKEVERINDVYEREFYSILTRQQKNKYNEIRHIKERERKNADKPLFKHDPNVRVFGVREECQTNKR